MKNILILIILLFAFPAMAQKQTMVEKEIEVGMKVKIVPCKKGGKQFETMDRYRKTRIPSEPIQIDSLTGDGVFEHFFSPGDFDAQRLPCEYGNQYYTVAALRVFEDEQQKERRIMILYTKEPYTMIWVEFDKAVEQKEIIF